MKAQAWYKHKKSVMKCEMFFTAWPRQSHRVAQENINLRTWSGEALEFVWHDICACKVQELSVESATFCDEAFWQQPAWMGLVLALGIELSGTYQLVLDDCFLAVIGKLLLFSMVT